MSFPRMTAAASAAALLFAGATPAQQTGPTRVGVQDPLNGRVLAVDGAGSGSASANAFNPALSVLLDGVYKNTFSGHPEAPAGFANDHDHDHEHGDSHGLEDGFNLRETEIALSASVDSYFDAIAIVAVDGDSIEMEEAYFTTRSLPAGLQIKAGKFLSDIGYINSQHPHDWDFVDRPLMSEVIFGDHGLQETGVQLSWVPPTPFYSRFGIEALQGTNQGVSRYKGEDDDLGLERAKGPRLFTAFARFAPDLGYNHAVQFGLSGGHASTWQAGEEHGSGRLEAWDGTAWFAGADLVYRYDAGRGHGHGDWKLQAEYVYREIDLDYAEDDGGAITSFSDRSRQDGTYLQAVYGIAPRWNAGLRAEAVGMTNRSVEPGNGGFETFDPSYRYSAQVTFKPTEFSRLRLQTSYADYAVDDDHHGDGAWTAMLQYTMSLGAHGAHGF
ncbi:MAG: TonB-dependent receptor [Aquisalimonadaceae bacterium]